MGKIEEAVKNGRCIKSVRRKLGIAQGHTYAQKNEQGIISKLYAIVKAAELFCTDLYITQSSHASFIQSSDEEDTGIPSITSEEDKMLLQAMTRGETAGEDGIIVDLFKDGGDITLKKLVAP